MKKEEIKYHKVLLEIIEQFKKPKSGRLISKKDIFNGRNAKFKFHQKEFKIEFQYGLFSKNKKNLDIGDYHKGIQIQFDDTIYNLESVFLETHAPTRMIGSVNRIHTVGYSEKNKYYYNLIIPLERELKFHYNIEETRFNTDLGYRSRTGTTAIIKGEAIQICCLHNDNKKYFLAIDSPIKQTFNEFAKKANAVKIGMGYLTGYYAGNQGFFFVYTKKDKKQPKHFRCVTLRNSIISKYSPIYSNAYGYLHKSPLAKKYYTILRTVSLKEFSLLCEKIYNSLDFSSILMLMLESSVANLLLMPGGYAIALETITDLITGNTKLNVAPIKDKKIREKLIKELLEVLDQNSASISPSNLVTLKNRIVDINKITNQARLRAPFDLLKITLLDEDLKILKTRNKFLHGQVPDLTKEGKKRSIERINKDLYYCSMRFYTLLNLVILKWIGYDNRVVNYPKIHESFTEIHLEEEPYRQV